MLTWGSTIVIAASCLPTGKNSKVRTVTCRPRLAARLRLRQAIRFTVDTMKPPGMHHQSLDTASQVSQLSYK